MRKLFAAALTSVLALAHTSAFAETDASVRDIVKKAELASYYAGDDGRTEARMLIVDAQGRKQTRQFTILRRDRADGGEQDLMVFFSRPADVRDTVFRVIKRTDADDDRWLYLPGLDLVKRISAGDKRTSFVGSNFFYEDVSGRNTELDDFQLVEETDSLYRLGATPKDPSSVEFSRYVVEIDKTTFIPMQIEFFDSQDRLYRKVQALKVETIQGYPTVTYSRIEDLLNGGATEMQFRHIKYNLGLPEDIFSERSLRTPPRQWLELGQ
ncbi:outer membrane lipoprotein-sorting protein [Halioxenophilus sp. WMMB6]|uniref:outer membrane lipoprotein-sorting protein n=1 Tax=Halioxenophilus sp. WMMB6 TaxID=3073815 RepID=UPI00295E7F91|nr:outer membrane lipoprotein-sorting protein [Halioxenophilus sp. WMMB6]